MVSTCKNNRSFLLNLHKNTPLKKLDKQQLGEYNMKSYKNGYSCNQFVTF